MLLFIKKVRKGLKIISNPLWRWALIMYRVAAGSEHVIVLSQLNALKVIVDIGANRGQFALVSRYCHPSATIISFEPLSTPAKLFVRVFDEDENIAFVQAAIGPETSSIEMHVSGRDDSSSILPISEMQNRLYPGTAQVATEVIRIAPLNEFITVEEIRSPALLKLDVQGFELQGLVGCEDLLKYFTWIYVESSFVELYVGQPLADEIIAWLREHGFKLQGVYNMSANKQGKAIQADFLFLRLDS